MLSTRAFSSSGAAGKYYAHADYYGSEAKGIWAGGGAQELGLTGEFNAKADSLRVLAADAVGASPSNLRIF